MNEFYRTIVSFYLFIIHFFQNFTFFVQNEKPIKKIPKTINELTNDYIQERKKKFLDYYVSKLSQVENQTSMVDITLENCKKNINIDGIFYSKSQYQEMLMDPNNPLEKKWKTKILFENTPRGNVIMHYDVYKLGFTYYCDQYLPYNLLNAVAMKYVMYFQCLDFFMDEDILPEGKSSPLIKLFEDDKKEEKEKKEKDDEKLPKIDVKNPAFAKFKNYNKISSKISSDSSSKKDSEKQIETNRFINMGKIINFQFLQPIKKKKSSRIFPSTMSKEIFDLGSVQKEVFNYRDYKKNLLSNLNK